MYPHSLLYHYQTNFDITFEHMTFPMKMVYFENLICSLENTNAPEKAYDSLRKHISFIPKYDLFRER